MHQYTKVFLLILLVVIHVWRGHRADSIKEFFGPKTIGETLGIFCGLCLAGFYFFTANF